MVSDKASFVRQLRRALPTAVTAMISIIVVQRAFSVETFDWAEALGFFLGGVGLVSASIAGVRYLLDLFDGQ